jgi:hypothetical protein
VALATAAFAGQSFLTIAGTPTTLDAATEGLGKQGPRSAKHRGCFRSDYELLKPDFEGGRGYRSEARSGQAISTAGGPRLR